MKHLRVGFLLLLLNALALAVFLSACRSEAPVAQEPEAYYQPQVQAVDHWRDMAVDVADRVLQALEDREDLIARPIFIAAPNNRPFAVAFYNLLKTELVSRGMQVSFMRERESVQLDYNIQTVFFDHSRGGAGSQHEIIVNARMYFKNRFVVHCSAVRYIDDADWSLYIDPQSQDPLADSTRNVRIVKK